MGERAKFAPIRQAEAGTARGCIVERAKFAPIRQAEAVTARGMYVRKG